MKTSSWRLRFNNEIDNQTIVEQWDWTIGPWKMGLCDSLMKHDGIFPFSHHDLGLILDPFCNSSWMIPLLWWLQKLRPSTTVFLCNIGHFLKVQNMAQQYRDSVLQVQKDPAREAEASHVGTVFTVLVLRKFSIKKKTKITKIWCSHQDHVVWLQGKNLTDSILHSDTARIVFDIFDFWSCFDS